MPTTRLTGLEQLLLLAVLRTEDDAHASVLQEILEQRGERSVSLGSIYVAMTRLEERGLVLSSMGEPTPERGGKAKRLYQIAPDGVVALEQNRRILDRMWEGLSADPAKART